MNIKRELNTIYIKYDTDFKTLSKKALAQIILKIIYFAKSGATHKHIVAELSSIVLSSVDRIQIDEALQILKREGKINEKNGKYFIQESYKRIIDSANDENIELHDFIYSRYFSRAESNKESILLWFQDATIKFLEQFSYEWLHQATHRSKIKSSHVDNLNEILTITLRTSSGIVESDQDWLKQQYIKFIDSDDQKESLLLWYYGISMFSSRLVTAQSRTDGFSVDDFRGAKFILDTNVLMILDLEAHDLYKSFRALEEVLRQLNVSVGYFHITREEYIRAVSYRKEETIKVFENFDYDLLVDSDCPFIRTALRRNCRSGEDVRRMFDDLVDVPERLCEMIPIDRYESSEIIAALEKGERDESLKAKINAIYKRRTKRDKREKPVTHDAGLVQGALDLRKKDKCWIITNDSILKIYAIENCLRDENEIAIGLDVLLGLLVINFDAKGIEASNFAPLFKNIVRLSLMPERDTFEVQDLAFILDTNLRINELPDDRVKEIAREVKRMRIKGEADEMISLYLRRAIEGEKLGLAEDLQESLERERIARMQKNKSERERDIFVDGYRTRRRGELRDRYDRELFNNRLKLYTIPVLLGLILFFTIDILVPNQSGLYQFLSGAALELVIGLLPLIPLNKRLVRKYSEYVLGIDAVIDREILELKRKAENLE